MKKWKRAIAVMVSTALMITSVPWTNNRTVAKAASETVDENDADKNVDTYKAKLVGSNLMQNDYIGMYTNGNGLFSIGTTGGDPENPRDNNQRLLYGYSGGSTSYTTFRINGRNYTYSANKMAFDLKEACNNSEVDYGGFHFEQKLTFLHNSATGRDDVVEIRYTATNISEQEQELGCRIMMDTQLGGNDSAPFRIPGVGAVTTETEFLGNDIPQIWQAFDNLSSPSVIAQGRFYKSAMERPDKVQFANWGGLRGTAWEYPTHAGSGNGDSGVAATWYEKPIAPKERREYVTYYGLSELSQDLSSPLILSVYSETELEECEGDYLPNPFPVNAYIENVGRETARAASVSLELPKGLQFAGDSVSEIVLGDIAVRAMKQASWNIRAIPVYTDKDYKIRVILNYDDGSSKSVTRTIHVPAVKKRREVPKALGYTLFSEKKDQDLSMYGWKSYVTGDVYTGRDYQYNGSILDIKGKVDAVGRITTNGWQLKIDERNEGQKAVEMPDLAEDIRSKAGEVLHYSGSKTYTEDSIRLERSVEAENDLNFAGTTFLGNGYFIAGRNITCGLNQGSTYNDGKIVMCSRNGDITLNGSTLYFDGILYAPNGTVAINANIFRMKGRIIAKHIVMNASQVYIEGQQDDVSYVFDQTIGEDENKEYTRVFTSDEDFAEGQLDDLSQRIDDALVLEYADSEELDAESQKDSQNADTKKQGTGFEIEDTISKNVFILGNEEALLTYHLRSFVDGTDQADGRNDEYDYVAPAAGRKVLFETTLLCADKIRKKSISPEPDHVIDNADGSITLQWKYDRLVAGDNFTYRIPLNYSGISETGLFPIVKNTALFYYDTAGDAQLCCLPDRSVMVSDVVREGTWETVCDSQGKGTSWNTVSWKGSRPDDSDIVVYAATSEDGDEYSEPVTVMNGQIPQSLSGRYIKLKVMMKRSTTGKTPVLEEIKVSTEQDIPVVNAAPALSLNEEYHVVAGQPVNLVLSSEDDACGKMTEYSIVGIEEGEDVRITESSDFVKQIVIQKEGEYSFQVIASDGTLCDTKNITIKVSPNYFDNIGEEKERYHGDDTCPVVEITAPDGEVTGDGRISVTGTAFDETEFGSYTLTYRADFEETEHLIICSDEAVVGRQLGELDGTELQDGEYILTLTAIDAAGNWSKVSKAFCVRHEKDMDRECPIAEISKVILNEDNTKILIFGTAKDERKLERYTLTLEDETGSKKILKEDTEPVTDQQMAVLDTAAMESGEYSLLLQVIDVAGNEACRRYIFQYTKGSTGQETYPTEGPAEEITDTPIPSETAVEPTPAASLVPTVTPSSLPVPTVMETPSILLKTETKFHIMLDRIQVGVGEIVHGTVSMSNIDPDKVSVCVGEIPLELTGNQFFLITKDTGTLEFVAKATDRDGQEVVSKASCKVYNLQDKKAPTAAITFPSIDTVLTEPVDIVGSAYDDGELDFWKLEYQMKGEKEWLPLAGGKEAVRDGVLGHLDTTMLMNGQYTIKLTVQDAGGNIRRLERDYVVEGELKVGAMHIGFTDITASLKGTTVNINRMYDSRDKTMGEFGYGWTLGMQGMEIYENENIFEGYELVKVGSLFSTGYQMTETLNHDVIVGYGDGTSDRFQITFSPERQALIPISEVKIGYRCVTNPKIKLEILGDSTAYVGGGQLVFLGEEMYKPLSYKLTTEEGTEIYLSRKKGVYQIVDNNENVITVDKNGYHSKDGKSITLKRDSEDRVISATDPAGNITNYAYDAAGDLVSVTDAAGRTVSFAYDKKHNLMSITDPMGVAVSRNEYDDDGRLIATIDADGNRMEYDYDVEGRTQSVKDRRGNTTVYTYDDNGNVLQTVDAYGNKTTNTYDKSNNLLSTTDANGNTTSYAYDKSGNVTKVTAADGTTVDSTYTQENLVSSIQMMDKTVMAMEYDDNGRITSIEDANGNETEYSYTSDGKLTGLTDAIGTYQKVSYDSEGNVASTTNGAGESASYTYDKDGKVTSVTISREEDGKTLTFTSHYSYNAAGDITESIDNAGNVTKYEYDDNGNQTASIDAKGRRITYAYDDLGNMTKTTYPDGTFESFTYDANGNNITATDRSGLTVTMKYDKLNRMTEKAYADGTKETYAYDAVGNVTEQTSTSGAKTTYVYDERNRNTSITDALGNVTAFAYDEAARLTSRTDAKGNSISYEYDDNGNIMKTTYADGNSVSSKYDARNRVTEQKDQNGNVTKYSYDGADRLTGVTDAYGNSYSYGYDGNGNLVIVTDPEGHVTRYAHDALGRVAKVTNALGKTMEYSYNGTGNITQSKDYDGTVTKYSYDNMDRMVKKTVDKDVTEYSYDKKGLLLAVSDQSGTVKYQYDKYDRLAKQTDVNGITLSYTYDKAGRVSSFDNGFGKTAYEYDLLDRVTRVVDRNGKATVYEYDELGNRSAVKYPNGSVMTYTYDACQRLKEEWVTDANGVTLAKYSYGLGKAGERLTITESDGISEMETTYQYDKLNRLVKEIIAKDGNELTNEYSYDKVSNRISKEKKVKGELSALADIDSQEVQVKEGRTTYTYNALNQMVTEESPEGSITYTYDANGNLIKQSGNKTVDYIYDKENHLLCATIQQGNSVTIESYSYDYAGNRLSKTVNESSTTYYVNDTSGSLTQVVAEIDKDGKETASYTRGEELLSIDRGGKIWYYHYDGHGSTRLLTNEAGRVTDRYAYDACGNLLQKEGDTENDFLYTGEQYNANTGLYYLRARYMDPSTGTFISMDSYQGSMYDPVSLHKYLYANANPVTYTDPSGYFSLAECSIASSIQSTLNSIHRINSLRNIIKWANAACTVYDTATEIRDAILGGGTVGDVMLSLLKGVIVGFMCDGMCKTSFGVVLKPMMAIFGLGNQVDQIQEAIKSGDPAEIAVRFVQLICMLFGLTSQCFTGDTLVSTEDGLRPIEEIQAGDYVWSENTETGEKELKKVLSVSITETKALVHVTTENGTVIDTTENHPFYVEGKGWCAAAELEDGDVLRTQDGETETVEDVQIENLDEAVKVYNLEIGDSHTYYVSADGVLVHNGCGDDDIFELDPKEINFSQRSVNKKFDTPSGKISIEKAFRQGPEQVENFPPISVIEVNGQYVVRDGNSRLLIAQKTKAKKIKVIIETALDACRDLERRLWKNHYGRQGSSESPQYK